LGVATEATGASLRYLIGRMPIETIVVYKYVL